MGIPTYTTEKPSNSSPNPHPEITTSSHPHPTTATTATPHIPLSSSTTAPAETSINPAVATTTTRPLGGHGSGSSVAHVLNASVSGGESGRGGTTAQEALDRLYEERMEEEYAKREGGA